jgi:subtilisin family serine protease
VSTSWYRHLNQGYAVTSGTSVAAAEISGIAALLLERAPSLSPDEVREILIGSAKYRDARGRNPEFGAGLVDASWALEVAPNRPTSAAAQ